MPEITADFWKTVNQYNWPGNIRELENAIESAVALCGDQLSADCLPLRVGQVRAEERGEEYPKKEVPHNPVSYTHLEKLCFCVVYTEDKEETEY